MQMPLYYNIIPLQLIKPRKEAQEANNIETYTIEQEI